jgi:hypothetical protein
MVYARVGPKRLDPWVIAAVVIGDHQVPIYYGTLKARTAMAGLSPWAMPGIHILCFQPRTAPAVAPAQP